MPPISLRLHRHLRPQTLAFSVSNRSSSSSSTQNQSPAQEDPNSTQKPPPQSERKSFAVATGELFIGIASRLIKSRNGKRSPGGDDSLLILDGGINGNGDGRGERNYSKERIGAVMEDEIEPEVIWEQRVKDVEAEKKRRVVTSPGFSFSAAGLLFPYHLGVAQFLIEKGYIKVRYSLVDI